MAGEHPAPSGPAPPKRRHRGRKRRLDRAGVKIGDGAIVAACSVVAGDIPPYTVFGGNPARVIKRRFDEGLTGLLLQFRWWDLEPEALVEVLPLLCDPDLEKVERELRARLAESN